MTLSNCLSDRAHTQTLHRPFTHTYMTPQNPHHNIHLTYKQTIFNPILVDIINEFKTKGDIQFFKCQRVE